MKQLLVFIFLMFVSLQCAQAQKIENAKTQDVKVHGNCGMCKKKIEKAANKAGEASAKWDENTLMAHITYDSTKTNLSAILQRVANAGYDSDAFRADQATYENLHECCHYERPARKATVKKKVASAKAE